MKKLIIILFAFLVACSNSPEKKIEKSFESQRFVKNRDIQVKDVIIYDTVTLNDIIKRLDYTENKIMSLDKKLNKIYSYKDSISIRFNYHNMRRDSSFRRLQLMQDIYEREFDHLVKEQFDYANLGKQIDDSIYAYKVKIITERGSFNFMVAPITFTIISPIFPSFRDSLTNFNN